MKDCLVTDFKVLALTIPTQEALESDGTLSWKSTTIVLVQLFTPTQSSIGYTYSDRCIVPLMENLIRSHVIGQNCLTLNLIWDHLRRQVRNDGLHGLCSMAISAIDNSLWDLKAKIIGASMVDLLGIFREKVEVYGSGGFTSQTLPELHEQMTEWKKEGIKKFKMKVGTHPEEDPARVHFVRECVGSEASLMVDANEAYHFTTALQLAQSFKKDNVCWYEQPVRDTDIASLSRLRERLPDGMNLATGEYIYETSQVLCFLRARAADVIQLDVTRCGGITGFLKAAAVCDAFNVPISTHCAPTLHVSLGCSVPGLKHLEYFYDHVRIEKLLFEGVGEVHDGFLRPRANSVGFGFSLKNQDLKRWQNEK